ncbi:MAG: hypothetical protein J6X83_02095 [Methanomicrobium sp.]|nr:hypothetical protein [Methanomicrobium sp.]
MLISNKAYDVLKFIAILILPLSELVSSLAAVFGWEWGAAVVAVLAAIHSFIGSIIKITSDAYKNCSGENDG